VGEQQNEKLESFNHTLTVQQQQLDMIISKMESFLRNGKTLMSLKGKGYGLTRIAIALMRHGLNIWFRSVTLLGEILTQRKFWRRENLAQNDKNHQIKSVPN